MTDYKLANSLANDALELWGSGQLAEAADRYGRAIAICPTYPDWHGAYAGVLHQLGRNEEATREYETVLTLELEQGAAETNPAVKVARYFLADHLRRNGEPAKALAVLAPAQGAFPGDWLIATARALALFAVGEIAEAKAVAQQAIGNAETESKKAELAEHLSEVLGGKVGEH
ncbi:tetratricopeptide repeat protein [Roseateles chitinivorans]|uniref:tetratricopeptide repeat protein n=1 Tax=Roseateles chitinivorans TaxID=2917965 RepID=UPI003D6767E8